MLCLSMGPGAWVCRVVALSAVLLAACSTTSVNRAPVVDRSGGAVRTQAPAHAAAPVVSAAVPADAASRPSAPAPVRMPPGYENAGKPGYYVVKPGDTLIRIALENGQTAKELVHWNSLDNPNHIEVGQVLRVVPPAGPEGVAVARPVSGGTVSSTPVGAAVAAASAPAERSSALTAGRQTGAGAGAGASSVPDRASAGAASAATAAAVASAQPAGNATEDQVDWIWPSPGQVVGEYDETKNKGVDIAGSAGDPVLAAADGKVVYAGSGLRGYGNLIILKHNNTYLSAYAHNQKLLVKEDQTVRRGQKIAEMGNSDADRVKLHFEIRRQGKPVDPVKLLPAR